MIDRVKSLFDPLVRLLLLAILLATVLPVMGREQAVARIVSDIAIVLLFFLNGLRLPRAEVLRGLANLRFLLPLIIWVFAAMGLAGWGASQFAQPSLPPSIALGFIFLGVLPSTVQSATAYTSIAGGNVASSVVAAATLNILGVFITAPIIIWLASGAMPDNATDIGTDALLRVGMILLVPFLAGQALQGRFGALVTDRRTLVSWMDRIAIAIAVYVAFSSAVEQGVWSLLDFSAWQRLLMLIGFMLSFGFFGAWWLGRALRLDDRDRIAFLFAGGQKSIAMGAPLAAVLFPPAIAGLVLLPVLIYHLLQLVISAPVAQHVSQSQQA
ncbi:hypothetical protein CP97_08325 [Aurantiacibacter atlanticus]|uniref:Bile acid:sodium symporter n=1 Tax=Aurantiacibacter atlanticus TaxID=1648404 RepID=A0A0H4VC90_9SPHN|nr:bile acid:sodium symporter family protein [Aurantiacibacter atlanticus]AKQ42025.1 hypothetical protein CP97_08325 [Aurantiacibacter atlanticus]MDF1834670.1 bile acid:sodium symporter [Alteraurantiacibacter sp. bin_em_oilr2.035]